jgi:phage baseplate assembly protein V
MIKFGKISEVDAPKGLVRVEFNEDGIVSGWLPYLVQKSLNDKYFFIFDVGEHVACQMDEHCENGVVMGAIYSAETAPDGGAEGKVRVKFSDGASVEYDKETQKLSVKVEDTELIVGADGHVIKKGGESLKNLLEDILAQIQTHTHPTGTGPSGPPVEAPAFAAIEARVPDVFEE